MASVRETPLEHGGVGECMLCAATVGPLVGGADGAMWMGSGTHHVCVDCVEAGRLADLLLDALVDGSGTPSAQRIVDVLDATQRRVWSLVDRRLRRHTATLKAAREA